MIVLWILVATVLAFLGLLVILAVIGSARLEAQTEPDELIDGTNECPEQLRGIIKGRPS